MGLFTSAAWLARLRPGGWRRTGRSAAALLGGILAAGSLWLAVAGPAAAQAAPPPPDKIAELVKLLDDPEVRAWLARAKAPPPSQPAARDTEAFVSAFVARMRDRLGAIALGAGTFPQDLGRARDSFAAEIAAHGAGRALALLLLLAALGCGAEWLARRGLQRSREAVEREPIDSVGERLKLTVFAIGLDLLPVLAFAAGALAAFLLADWPPILHEIVLAVVTVLVAVRGVLALGGVLLAPIGATPRRADLRFLPMSDERAAFWHGRIAWFVGWYLASGAAIELMQFLGFSTSSRRLAGYVLALGLLAIASDVIWRTTRAPPGAEPGVRRGRAARLRPVFWTIAAAGLWILWVIGAKNLFWLAVVAVALAAALRIADRAVDHMLRPVGGSDAAPRGALGVIADRGLRAALVIGAVLFLAYAWDVDLVAITATDSVLHRLARGGLSAVVIVLAADLLWQLAKVMIDRQLVEAQAGAGMEAEEARRRARLRTLLPIFRNVALVVVVATTVLMVLSSLGVAIGPLIAGAGVVGVAIGFGSQTLVKDIISGVFYLLDDAFRVGEYIQSKNYKGTVEAFSLRSVKLRHHRGPLYTVPFGELGAVQNMSRDWVIDKITLNLAYDTDLDRVKKLLKQVGRDLAAHPEYGPHILEPLRCRASSSSASSRSRSG